ncbi:Rne/Rng family ribonuclease [Allofrancisella guangzhouensis]|uniref:Ribonuclease E n=1 Tax=Allofrancisella guangzhouensis TaxID=594679 RepID=A0A0A8E9Z4_9GAMM|nr:Rne/Rng family ribonuclease [Allofrancisella guangzhouensis]AJC48981.1 ribonuclease E [Allofrancisella guangzhouensis]MBK2027886.1 Rne/Rng family ribonuclease [Allofrancisella guangzhouensis]MBK2044139.1 Rne/Rng family ribonuclease [Allofrancisella guangzhouensis]MBK2045119.1 Rne/Rng family ribonuclease [Allofrancisella guangzhouensis]
MKKILINSKNSEEIRIATLDNGKLIDLDIENVDREQKKANIYKGYISRIEPSLNAIFVNYGEEKNGFLPFKEVSEYYLKDTPTGENIAHLLSEGQELIVQIDKEERGDKGAALTTFITLAGSYMVLLPNNPEGGGISRRVEGEDREKLKKYLKDLNIPKNMSVIARTACVECSFGELKHDFDTLVELWQSITQAYHKIKKPALLHKESDIIVRTVRDHLKEDVKEIIVDSKECFDDVKRQLSLLRQSFDINKVKLYNEELPLFTQHGIDQQIENAYKREIRLPSGGSIVIDTTEALVAIDVNSSRSNKAEDVETTAFKTNLEAAEEVARQLRIRDLGGLVIVDFIDMSFYPNRKQVEEKLMEALQQDKARIQMSRISKLGLVEISRQRLSSSINESVMQKCPRCEGHGFIKTTQATALTILRKVRAEAMKDDTNEIRVQVPVDMAAYILNEKRENIVDIERISNVKVIIIPNFNMESPKFQMQRIWGASYKSNRTSPELIEDVYNLEIPKAGKKKIAAVDLTKTVETKVSEKKEEQQQDQQSEILETKIEKKSLFAKLANAIFGTKDKSETPQTQPNKKDLNENNSQKNSKPNNKNKENNEKEKIGGNKPLNNTNKDDSTNSNNKNRHDRDNNQRNNKNNYNNERNTKNKKNDDTDRRSSNKNNSRSSNININDAEEVVDITKEKYKSQITENPIDNVKKIISRNPDEFISVMVKDILDNYDSLKSDNAKKITTEEKVKTQKYLKFDTVSVDAELANTFETTDKKEAKIELKIDQQELTPTETTEKPKQPTKKTETKKATQVTTVTEEKVDIDLEEKDSKKSTKPKADAAKKTTKPAKEKVEDKKVKQESINEYISYSAAVDFESQKLI